MTYHGESSFTSLQKVCPTFPKIVRSMQGETITSTTVFVTLGTAVYYLDLTTTSSIVDSKVYVGIIQVEYYNINNNFQCDSAYAKLEKIHMESFKLNTSYIVFDNYFNDCHNAIV